MNVGERIKYIRKEVNKLTLEMFGQRIGISAASVSALELGKNNPSEQTIRMICREFGCNEVWLRTGVGEPFEPKSRRDCIDEYIGQLSAGKRTEIEQLLVEVMAKTTVEEWKAIAEVFRKAREIYEKHD